MNNSPDDQNAVGRFFLSPSEPPGEMKFFGVLYLLRRDIITCFGINPDTDQPTGSKAVIPGVMCIFAGIDLMGKFYAGSDAQKGVGDRFKAYLQQYFNLDANDAETIYQLRNAILHSFSLFSRTAQGTIYRFELMIGENPLIERYMPDRHRINPVRLFERWEESISRYSTDLIDNQDLQEKFVRMMPEYGFTGIGAPPQNP